MRRHSRRQHLAEGLDGDPGIDAGGNVWVGVGPGARRIERAELGNDQATGKTGRARIRRVGVRIEKLVPAAEAYQQPTLDAPERGMREVELAADALIRRFGPNAVGRATLAGST